MSAPLKRKASLDAEEAQRDERRSRRWNKLRLLDANEHKASESEKQAIRLQQQEQGVWSHPVLERIKRRQPGIINGEDKDELQKDVDALWLGSGDDGIDNVEQILEVILDIPDTAPYCQPPPEPVRTGTQDDDILLKTHAFQMEQVEKENELSDKAYADKCRIAVAMRRLYKELDHSIRDVKADQSNKCQKLDTQMEVMLTELAGMRNELSTLHNENMSIRNENAAFRVEIQQLRAEKGF